MAKPLAALFLALWLYLPLAGSAAQPVRPTWNELTAVQRDILAPLQADWLEFSPEQRKRWVALADRYPKLKPAEQKRVQERMSEWAKLTPKQREAARARYRALSKLSPEQRNAVIKQWTESQEAQQAPVEPAATSPESAPADATSESTPRPDGAAGETPDRPTPTP